MQRRSTRLPKQLPTSSAEVEEFRPEDEDVEEFEDFPISKNQRGKKRKVNDDSANGQPQAKKVRGKRGILKQLVEMPLDLLFEIFGRLEPIDVLHLARTTKDLRILLMSRSSMSIWKASRSNVPGIPECPQDLSEPQYINLIFGKSCYFCNRNLGRMHIVWSARLRTCTKCLEERFSEKDSYNWNSWARGYPTQLAHFVPTIDITKKSGRYMRSKTLYFVEVDERWHDEYPNAEDQEQWLEDKLEERIIINKHADACTHWFENLQDLREQQKASMIDGRKALFVERLKKLGWEDELSKMSDDDPKAEDDPVVLKACQKEITESALSNLEEFLGLFMENQKRRRLVRERESLLEERLRILKGVLQSHVSTLPVNAFYPSVGEVFRNPVVRDIINNTPTTVDFTEEHFDPIILMFSDITLQWRKDVEQQLVALVVNATPEYNFDRETVLDLATTLFTCGCQTEVLRYPDILMHSCATHNYYFTAEEDSDLSHLKNILLEVFWNASNCISSKTETLELVTEVIEICGFDPKTTTAAEMDKASHIIECVSCNDVHEGRATMTWLGVLVHREQRHRQDENMTLELLNEQEAGIVRARMSEIRARERAGRYYDGMVCVHCKQTGNTPGLMKHVKKDHGNPTPTHEDVIPLRKSKPDIAPLFRLWPPRE